MASKKLGEVLNKKTVSDSELTSKLVSDNDTDSDDLKAVIEQLQAEDDSVGKSLDEKEESDAKEYKDMSEDEKKAAVEQLVKDETTIGTKTLQEGKISIKSGKTRLDEASLGKDSAELGGKITEVKKDGKKTGKYHYEGTLGSFDYDPDEWAIGTKEITAENGAKATIPILRCIVEDNDGKLFSETVKGEKLKIPEGVKSLDYTFEDMDNLKEVPDIPDSVESAHCAFSGCKNMTRACESAKDDEADTSIEQNVGTGVAVAGGTAATIGGAVLAGAAVGSAGTPIGTLIGAGVGLVGGVGTAIFGTKTAVDAKANDGKGGTWNMPKGLKDASYMFADCESLTEGYKAANDELINARGMYKGNTKIGTDKYANKHGSVDVTDFKDSKLSKEAVQGSYDDASADTVNKLANQAKKDGKGNYSDDWDENTGTLNREGISDDEKKEVEDLSKTLKDQDVKNGIAETDMSVMTDGSAYTASQQTSIGEIVQTTNVNDINQETDAESKESESLFGNAGSLLDRGIVSLGEYKILKMVTGNTLLSAGITFGGQMLGILPKSLKPVLTTVAGFVGTDSTLGKGLNSLADKLPDSSSEKSTTQQIVADAQDVKEKSKSDNTLATSDSRVSAGMKDALNAATTNTSDDITKIMMANGQAIGKDGILVSCANKSANDAEFKNMNDMTMLSAAALEEKAIAMAGDGKMSKDDKKALASEYMTVMNGLAAYDNGAEKALSENYSGDDLTKGKTGLSRVMKATTAPFYDSMKELNEKYDFLSKDDIKKLDNLNITGVDKFSDYKQGTMYVYVQSEAENNKLVESTSKTADGTIISEEEALYANAGLEDDISSDNKSQNVLTVKSNSVAKSSSALVESRSFGNSKGCSETSKSRGSEAESKFADLLSKNDKSSDLQMDE